MTGYMASSYLIPQEEATARYGENSGFGDGRAAEIDLTGMWMTSVTLRETTDDTSTALATLDSNSKVGLLGILDAWAYIWAETDDGRKLGYVPLDVLTDVGNLKVSIISSGKTDKKTILYDAPTAKAKEIMRLSNGTACFTLFGRKEGEWRRVRVGGVSGWIKYTQTGNLYALGDQMRSVVPYYPLLMQTKSDTLLYQQKDDAASRYMTLGQGMYVELLAESDSYAYVRTSEGGAGAYDCGDFGFLPIANLSLAQTSQSIGVAQADDGDLPVVVLGDPDDETNVIGALCCLLYTSGFARPADGRSGGHNRSGRIAHGRNTLGRECRRTEADLRRRRGLDGRGRRRPQAERRRGRAGRDGADAHHGRRGRGHDSERNDGRFGQLPV